MAEYILSSIKNHPDYESTISEVVNKQTDEKLMAQAVRISNNEAQSEALYVLLKLKGRCFP